MERLFPLVAIILAGCAPVSGAAEAIGTPTAALDQVANVGSLTIKPLAVIEDSRCPKTVQCVWAGRLVLRTLTDAGAGGVILDLILGEPVEMGGGGQLTLVDAQPPKLAPGSIDPRQYRFTFAWQSAR